MLEIVCEETQLLVEASLNSLRRFSQRVNDPLRQDNLHFSVGFRFLTWFRINLTASSAVSKGP